MIHTTLQIQNLKCHGCANTIITRLKALDGINNVNVTNETHSVSFDAKNKTVIANATALLSNLGYPVAGDENTLHKKAKSFMSCAIGRIKS